MRKIIFFFLLSLVVSTSKSQWSSNPSINNVVSNRSGSESETVLVSDGANGAIAVFVDYQDDNNIYAQRINSSGAVTWGSTSNPVTVSNSTGPKYEMIAIADGAGGAYIAWSDYRHSADIGEIYLQKISAAGVVQWTTNGLRVTNNTNRDDIFPLLCLDGAGGVLLTWYGNDSVAQSLQNYAQRYNSSGIAQWMADGVQVATATGFRASTAITPDGAGGAFIAFIDTRNDPNGLNYAFLTTGNLTNSDLYGQRLNSAGTRLWGNNGAAICTAAGNQADDLDAVAVPDGSGNFILIFSDGRNDPGLYENYDIFAQKINSSGIVQWASNGVPVCTAAENQFVTGAVSDGAGGVVVSIDYNNISRLYAQRITNTGAASWTVNGVPISQAGDVVYDGSICADGSGNSILTFIINGSQSVRAQKLNSAGGLPWGAAGTLVCGNADAYPSYPEIIASDAGSVIIAWSDGRNFGSSQDDIYASKVLANGLLDGVAAGTISIANGNWNNPAIWSGGVVPATGATVIIRHNVVGNVNASCASVSVESPGNLSVSTGVVITITN